jgi:hypothetical protein
MTMLKSKKFWIAVILLIVTNIGTAAGCMWVAQKITALHVMSVYCSMNFKKVEDTKLLLTAIADEIKKDPAQAILKIEKLRQQIPNSYEGFRTAEELKKAGFK